MYLNHQSVEKKITDFLLKKNKKIRKTIKPTLIILTGESCAGKTILVNKLSKNFDFIRIQNDELRVHVFKQPKLNKKEDLVFFSIIDKIVLKLLRMGYLVIWDARFPDPKVREKKYEKITAQGFGFLCIYVQVKEKIRHGRQAIRDLIRMVSGDKTYFYNKNLEKLREKNHREYIRPLRQENKYILNYCNNNSKTNTKNYNRLRQSIENLLS